MSQSNRVSSPLEAYLAQHPSAPIGQLSRDHLTPPRPPSRLSRAPVARPARPYPGRHRDKPHTLRLLPPNPSAPIEHPRTTRSRLLSAHRHRRPPISELPHLYIATRPSGSRVSRAATSTPPHHHSPCPPDTSDGPPPLSPYPRATPPRLPSTIALLFGTYYQCRRHHRQLSCR